ncbi:MAG: hypothetical protein ACQEQM_07925 [Thermoplasmatota archaeon]
MKDKNKKKINSALTEGSHYIVKSLATREESLETRGFFEGYVSLGRGHALRIKLDDTNDENEGEVRIVPNHMITSIDIIKENDEPEENKKPSSSYFG